MEREIFSVKIDPAIPTLAMMFCGEFDSIDENVLACKAPPGMENEMPSEETNEAADVELLSFEKDASFEEMLAQTKARGYRPATLREFIALEASHKKELADRAVITIGAAYVRASLEMGSGGWSLSREYHVPCAYPFLGDRNLVLGLFDGKYRPGCHFASVRLPEE